MTNRIDATLAKAQQAGKKLLSPYITAGDPEPGLTVSLMHALVEAGADILELGIPFSDPMAEGPVIQQAMERALAHGVHTDAVLEMIAEFRKNDAITPIVIMGYLNPIEQYGYERFAKNAVNAGADATILVDLPPEEAASISTIWHDAGLHSIFLCSPTTTDDRLNLLNAQGRGYLYYVSLKGVTGSDTLNTEALRTAYLDRKQKTHLPLLVGFGIKTPELAAQVASFADGVIVGAALISEIIEAYRNKNDVSLAAKHLIGGMRQAIDHAG